jgi:hypothetical protein
MGMFENLDQPYHFNNNFKHNLRTISLVSVGFMLIVLYFQPFGINFLNAARNGYFVFIMGLVSAATLVLSTMVLPGFFPKLFESSRWTIRKELIWNACMFVVMIAGFALAAHLFNISSFQSMTLVRSGAMALLPLILFNLLNYNRSLKNKVVQVIDTGRNWLAEERKTTPPPEIEKITLKSENGKEIYNGGLENIILIQSSSNYIEIIYRDGPVVKRQLIRQTLVKVEKMLELVPNILKCHRGTLVNIAQVSKIRGKLPNVTLEVEGLGFQVPISRQRVALFKKLIAVR